MLQKVGRIWLPQLLFKPNLKLTAYSVDDNNVFASIATYYCHLRWSLLEAEVLLAGRLSSHLSEGKAHKNTLLTFNVYGPPNADLEGRRALDRLLEIIKEKIRLVKLRFPSVSCYIARDWNVNLNDESLPKSKALRSFTAAGQLFEMTAKLPPTRRGIRGDNLVFQSLIISSLTM